MSIASELERLQLAKNQIKTLLKFRGFDISDSDGIDDYLLPVSHAFKIEKPFYENLQTGYVNSAANAGFGASAVWIYEEPNGGMTDVYKVKANHKYLCYVGVPGTRFRVMTCTTNPVGSTSDISGTLIVNKQRSAPNAGDTWSTDQTPSRVYLATSDCYLLYMKDNTYNSQIKTNLIDITYLENPGSPGFETDLHHKHVGGKIFYINPDSDRQVKFYDSNHQEIQTVSVGDSPAYYEVINEGISGKDKYYVYDNTTGRVQRTWGFVDIETSATKSGLGYGKENTRILLNTEDTSGHSRDSIWTYLKEVQNINLGVNRCTDWYVGSRGDINKFIESNLEPTWFDDDYMWSSTDNTSASAWVYNIDTWRGYGKNAKLPCCFFRSF